MVILQPIAWFEQPNFTTDCSFLIALILGIGRKPYLNWNSQLVTRGSQKESSSLFCEELWYVYKQVQPFKVLELLWSKRTLLNTNVRTMYTM